MSKRLLRVYSIAAGAAFLEILADEVLKRFPNGEDKRPLSDWTILLPTRRAARKFSEILQYRSGKGALIMPRIKPIGDLDEDSLQKDFAARDLPPAMSKATTLVVLQDLVRSWARSHDRIDFAKDILASPGQCLGLAKSLAEFVTTIETQECDIGKLPVLYDSELAEHRDAIISLLQLATVSLRDVQARLGTMGAAERRSAIIRSEAVRIEQSRTQGPIIAAGSTGTIPATGLLLNAIARHENGAIILPGLDQTMDSHSWDQIEPEHPQFALKQLLESMELKPTDVQAMGAKPTPRNFLLSELMRPSKTAEQWHDTLPRQKTRLEAGLSGITEIAAPDRHTEARTIAVILRESLGTKSQTAALITPDRDLAKRVVSELGRWNIAIADSAGSSLAQSKLGAAFDLLLQALLEAFTPEATFAVLRNAAVQNNLDSGALENYELAVLRGLTLGLASFEHLAHQARALHDADSHPHPAVKALTEEDWSVINALGQKIDTLIAMCSAESHKPFTEQAKQLESALRLVTAQEAWEDASDSDFFDFMQELLSEPAGTGVMSLAEAALLLRELLRSTPSQQRSESHPRLAIFGTLEARLIPADLIILGGLNEGGWPSDTDTGPWLNRKMRETLGLPQPERDIGMAAHDFEQGLAQPKVIVTWSKRLNHAPASPSRWLLRLNTVLAAAGITPDEGKAQEWLRLTAALQTPNGQEPFQEPRGKPLFAPPLDARPRRYSATDIEKLIRNPYAIYARKVLALEPLPNFGSSVDASDRGTLFHLALQNWNMQVDRSAHALLAEGKKVFAKLLGSAEVQNFWWPHFRRIATWLAEEERGKLSPGLVKIHTEQSGKLKFAIDDVPHVLTGRADRIDVLEGGALRLIDYKSGAVPSAPQVKSGLSPQMTVQTALLLEGAFAELHPKAVAEALYIQIGRNRSSQKIQRAGGVFGDDLQTLAHEHLARFKELLREYRSTDATYLPRAVIEKDEDEADYDHLSRYLEWQLSQQKPKAGP